MALMQSVTRFLGILLACAGVALSGCSAAENEEGLEVQAVSSRGEGQRAPQRGVAVPPFRLWPNSVAAVCWVTPGFLSEKQIIQTAVQEQYNARTNFKFTEWLDCPPDNAGRRNKITVVLEDDRSYAEAGFQAGDSRILTVNVLFARALQGCAAPADRRVNCIKAIALHEFGHAAGLLHEHHRPDRDPLCPGPSPSDPLDRIDPEARLIGAYDPESIMNYCAGIYNRPAILSNGDVQAINTIYPSSTAGIKECAFPRRAFVVVKPQLAGKNDEGNPVRERNLNLPFDATDIRLRLVDGRAEGETLKLSIGTVRQGPAKRIPGNKGRVNYGRDISAAVGPGPNQFYAEFRAKARARIFLSVRIQGTYKTGGPCL